MLKIAFTLIVICMSLVGPAQKQEDYVIEHESIEASFIYQHGTIHLKGGMATVTIPKGFKYLNAKQAEIVLVDILGKPKRDSMTLGLLLPEAHTILCDSSYIVNISYDPIGYVTNAGSDTIDYNELLINMKSNAKEGNIRRTKLGYDPIIPVAWVSKLNYNQLNNTIYWALEFKYGEADHNILNYNIRVLGRRGVLGLNIVTNMSKLPIVQKDLQELLQAVTFTSGYKYTDFSTSTDSLTAWNIKGLVTGKLQPKESFFASILKFWKVIAIGASAVLGALWQLYKGNNND